MILYALACEDCGHEFEAWFASSDAFDEQSKRRLVECPKCDGRRVGKQIMAPAIRPSERPAPPDRTRAEAEEAEFLRRARDHVERHFDYVGENFAEEARAMYYGEVETRAIWGETTPEEREALKEEGVPAFPLPPPVAPRRPVKGKRAIN